MPKAAERKVWAGPEATSMRPSPFRLYRRWIGVAINVAGLGIVLSELGRRWFGAV